MSGERWIAYSFAFLRVVPHVHVGAFQNVGVVLHARTEGYLGFRAITEAAALGERVRDLDLDLLSRYLRLCGAICAGDPDAGPVALAPSSERFHWLTALRSDVLQPSPIHSGICLDPARELDGLFASCIGADGRV